MIRLALTRSLGLGIIAILAVMGFGCGGGSGNDEIEVRGVVLTGDNSAFANPTGADGLTRAGSGIAVRVTYEDSINFFTSPSPKTDSQGRFSFRIKPVGTETEFYCDIDKQCSTVAGVEPTP